MRRIAKLAGVGEVRMFEQVERLGGELQGCSFRTSNQNRLSRAVQANNLHERSSEVKPEGDLHGPRSANLEQWA